jgi:hypothetical protein
MVRLNAVTTTRTPIRVRGEKPRGAAGLWSRVWAGPASKAFRASLLRAFGVWAA